MKKSKWWLLLAFCLLLLPNLAQAKDIDEFPTVAVMPMTNKAPVTMDGFGDYSGTATESMIFEVASTGRFECIERDRLQEIVDEHSLNLTGLVDPSRAAEIGKLFGADYLAFGSVTSLTAKESGGAAGTGWGIGGMQKHKVSATVMLRVVDVNTGKIVLFGRGKGKSESTGTMAAGGGVMVMVGSASVSEEQCENAIEKAVKDAVVGKEGIIAQLDGKR